MRQNRTIVQIKKRGQPAKPIKLIVSSFRVAPKKKDLFRKRVNLFLKEYQ